MRITNAVKAMYKFIGSDTECYYCGSDRVVMSDTTPNYKASEEDKEAFPEEWVICRLCTKCWNKIHTANIVAAGVRHGVKPGCMTLSQKKALCTGEDRLKANNTGFELGFNGAMIVPTDLMMDVENPDVYMHPTGRWTRQEIVAMQGPMALRMAGAPTATVRQLYTILMHYDVMMGTDYIPDAAKYQSLLRI